MATNRCAHEGCNYQVNTPHDSQLCIFHAPIEKKGKTIDEFNQIFFQQRKPRERENYAGYIFPGPIDASRKTFYSVNFDNAIFCGDADFSGCNFEGIANFHETKFLGDAEFSGAIFKSRADFDEVIL